MNPRGPSHARDTVAPIAYRPRVDTRDSRQAILESTLSHAVIVDLLDPVRPDEAEIDDLAERLERHAPIAAASPAACHRTALHMLDARSGRNLNAQEK